MLAALKRLLGRAEPRTIDQIEDNYAIPGPSIIVLPDGRHAMVEPDQFRVVQEAADLSEKLMKLSEHMQSPAYQDLPYDERADLADQLQAMGTYLSILNRRINRFGTEA